jgi:hypothetical protein
MPHQVTKATARGSQGDLAKITEALASLTPPVNIVAIGGGEGVLHNGAAGDQEIGVISMILEPDDGPMTDKIVKKLTGLKLGPKRTLEDVEVHPNIHIQLDDKPGELKKALDAVAGINIRSVLSMGTLWGTANVGLGFSEADHENAEKKLKAKGIKVVSHPH